MSQGSFDTAKCLSELSDQYRLLLEGCLSDKAQSTGADLNKHAKYFWSRVQSIPHFEISGCRVNILEDDLLEAKQELEALERIEIGSWALIFNPRDHELPRDAQNVDQHRLSPNELE